MKAINYRTMKILKLLTISILFLIIPTFISAQGIPDPPDSHGETGDRPPGGNAPIASGITILLTLGAAYGGRKTYQLIKQENKDN